MLPRTRHKALAIAGAAVLCGLAVGATREALRPDVKTVQTAEVLAFNPFDVYATAAAPETSAMDNSAPVSAVKVIVASPTRPPFRPPPRSPYRPPPRGRF